MVKNINKIAYLLISTALCATLSLPAYAVETVQAVEILTREQKDSNTASNESPIYLPNAIENLGERHTIYTGAVADRPEIHLKSWGEYIQEKRQANLQKEEVKKQSTKKEADLILNCNEMEYFEDRNELEARGKVEITTSSNTKVYADKALYNKNNNTIQLFKNVTLLKGTATVNGDYMLVDLNEENAIMDEPQTRVSNLIINAKEGYAYADRIENLNGNVELNKQVEMELYSRGFVRFGRAINDTRLVDFDVKKDRSKPYKFKTKQIEIRPEKDHDSMVMKDVDIYYGKRKVLNVPSIELFSDKEMTYSEVNFPLEFGSLKGFGTYLGMGYTFKLPKTFTFRATPAIVYGDNEFGVGAMAQLKSKKTRSEIGWASSTNNLVFDGEYRIFNKLKLDVGRHVYKNEWIAGGNRAGYIAELNYEDVFIVKELGNAVFRHKVSGGWVADYKREHQEDDMDSGFRYRYQAELSKLIKRFGSREQDMYLDFSVLGQTMATLYSDTGDTFGLFRVGPSLTSKVKKWNSSITYTLGGVHGRTPYHFDEYRYGRQTVSFDESIICNKYLSLGYRGTLTPLKDNTDRDILTENRFYAIAGPEDIKVAFSYDTIRQNMYVDFLFLLGADNMDVKYDKLVVKDPEKLGRRTKKETDRELNRIKVPETL